MDEGTLPHRPPSSPLTRIGVALFCGVGLVMGYLALSPANRSQVMDAVVVGCVQMPGLPPRKYQPDWFQCEVVLPGGNRAQVPTFEKHAGPQKVRRSFDRVTRQVSWSFVPAESRPGPAAL